MIPLLLFGDFLLLVAVFVWFAWKKTRRSFRPGLGTEELLQRLNRFLLRRGYNVVEFHADRLLIRYPDHATWIFVNSVASPLKRSQVNDYAIHAGRGDHYILTNHPVGEEIRQFAQSLELRLIQPDDLPTVFPGVAVKA
jgi:hypothetical protein